MDKKLGVYICSGCSIGDSLDTESLVKIATGEGKAASCQVHPFLCSEEGVSIIRKDLAEDSVNAVAVAACSPRVKTEAFTFDPSMVLERVNLREHVVWCQTPNNEDTQMMAEDYLRMGLAKAQKMERLSPVSETISKKLLVVGGGVTGLTAALEAADTGYEVILVEREDALGGYVAGVKSRFPGHPPYNDTLREGIQDKIDAVRYHPKIQVLTSALIEKINGQPGMFDVEIEVGGSIIDDRVGAIVQATGWKPYNPLRLGHLGYGASPDVITNIEFEEMAAKGRIFRPSDGKPVRSVLFIQCAGSRDKEHLPYCSSVCCMTTLKQAGYIREQNPNAKIYIIYKDIRTPGQYEKYYKAAQEDSLTFFTKGEVVSVKKKSPIELAATVADTLLGGDVEIKADIIVLAAGMVPNSADGEAIRALEDAERKGRTSDSEKQRAEAVQKAKELQCYKGTEILNLTYRQGPDLPAFRYGFPDSHFVCFPYETRRTAIYTAGAVRAPMDSTHAMEDALGATMKSIQSVEMAVLGQAAHPRVGDISFPDFFLQRCTQCKRCTEECPFGSLDEDEKGTPKPNPYRCRRCGVCLGACPERIISFKNYSVDMIASMIKSIKMPDEEDEEEKPRILAFICENDAYPALDIAGLRRLKYDASVRVIPLRCLGSMNIVWIADALSGGFDGILLIGCKFGDDYQCHFIKGSELADRRMENVKETLQRLQLESERLKLTQLSINEPDTLAALINEFADQIREIGPNPYKDM